MLSLLLFELRRNLSHSYARVFFLVLLLPGFLLMSGLVGSLGRDEPANTVVPVLFLSTMLSMLAMLGVGGQMAQAVHQDFASRIHPLLFTTPVTSRGYLLGRYVGALLGLLVVLPATSLGMWLGTLAPWSDRLYLPNRLELYLWPLCVLILPNCVLLGTLCFSVAALTRRLLSVYVLNLLLALVVIISLWTSRFEDPEWHALLDPSGLDALFRLLFYKGRAAQDEALPPFEGVLLANRLLWLGVSGVVLALTLVFFRRTHALEQGGSVASEPGSPPAHRVPPPASRDFRTLTWLRSLPRLSALELKGLVRTPAFTMLMLATAAAIIFVVSMVGREMGAPSHPVTYLVLERASRVLLLLSVLSLGFFAGELVWRDRDHASHLLVDAMPAPGWVSWASKLLALVGTQVPLTLVAGVSCALVQLIRGYSHLEPRLYALELLGVHMVDVSLVAVLALLLHAGLQQRTVANLVLLGYLLTRVLAGRLGLELHLFQYGVSPRHTYSDLNGYAPFVSQMVAYRVYWGLVALVLAFGIHLLWARGTELGLRERLAEARARLTSPVQAGLSVSLLGAALAAGWILYNTHHLNHYLSSEQQQAEQVDYERRYKPLAEQPQPALTSVRMAVDLFPGESRVEVRGTYGLLNRHAEPVRQVYVTLHPEVEVRRLSLAGAEAPAERDARHGVYTFQLPEALAPGARAELHFELEAAQRGFPNGQPWTSVAENGTFLLSSEVLPELGYAEERELTLPTARKRLGLPERKPPAPEDPESRRTSLSGPVLFGVDYEVTVSTRADQVALAPGDLQREWTEGGRRFFHYVLKAAPAPLYVITSGRYQVHRDKWREVPVEIYHHPAHAYNVQRMAQAVKDSLEYYTSAFGPYPYRQVRIIEFPRYQPMAIALPHTIPFSEEIGFLAKADPEDPEDLDYPYYNTAHELAHQWWGQQVRPARALGMRLITEVLAQYSALMVVKRSKGEQQIGRVLQFEKKRYLLQRASDSQEEPPLWRVEGQSNVYYGKGAVAMYGLQSHLGEDTLNQALAAFLKRHAYQADVLPTSQDLLEHLRAATPEPLQPFLQDTFERVVFYDFAAEQATAKPLGKGVWQVKLKVRVGKKERQGVSGEKELPVDDWVEVGVLNEKGKALYLQRHHFTQAETELVVEVKGEPERAGLDPYNKLMYPAGRAATISVEVP